MFQDSGIAYGALGRMLDIAPIHCASAIIALCSRLRGMGPLQRLHWMCYDSFGPWHCSGRAYRKVITDM